MSRHRGILERGQAKLRALWSGNSGAAAIEFAFGGMILFAISMGIIDVGRAMHTMNTIEHAAKEGARYASHHGSQSIDPKTDQEIGDYIKQKAVGVDSTDVTVQVQWNPDDAPGSVVVINVTYPFRLMYASVLSTDPYDLTARSTYTVSR